MHVCSPVPGIGAVLVLLFSLSACEMATYPAEGPEQAKAVSSQASGLPVRPETPSFGSGTPLYPAIAVYIVYREYVNLHPGITTLSLDMPEYQRYMEKRLRELYPDRGYSGMMRDAVAEVRQNRQTWERHEREMDQYRRGMASLSTVSAFTATTTCSAGSVNPYADQDSSWEGQEEFAVLEDDQLPTIQMEIDSLGLVGSQVQDIYYYESLANGTYAGGGGGAGGCRFCEGPPSMESVDESVDDLIRAAAAGYTPSKGEVGAQVDPVTAGAIAVSLGLIGWKAYRAATAHELAREKSTELFANQVYNDTQRDAHRHIYWSMMLRRWVGKFLAKSVTDWYENDSNSSGPARVMDLHNNDIGRTHRYNHFRGHWLWDRWDTSEWAIRVRNYLLDESTNGEYIPEWYEATITTSLAWDREACVLDDRYIFFSRDVN
jgi:hypothetical protein